MKGISLIGIIVVILATVALFLWVSKEIFNFIINTFSQASGENVARQLSNFMTVSGASYACKITYIPTREATYNIQIKSRILKASPIFNVPYAEKTSGIHPFATNFTDYQIKDVNSFMIIKRMVSGEAKYEFSAKKV
jgi:hypothetical protein